MRSWDVDDAQEGDLVEAVDCSFSGTLVTIDRGMGACAVQVDDPRFSGIKKDVVLGFSLDEVELVMRCDA
jgi:hypothetical protein